jgi:hypothetical protein
MYMYQGARSDTTTVTYEKGVAVDVVVVIFVPPKSQPNETCTSGIYES